MFGKLSFKKYFTCEVETWFQWFVVVYTVCVCHWFAHDTSRQCIKHALYVAMCSVSCDFGRHFDDAARKIDSCAQSFGKAEPLECIRVSRAVISHTWKFSERMIGDVSEDPSVSAELRPRVKLRSPIVTLWGTQRCSQWEPENFLYRLDASKLFVLGIS